MMTPEQAAGLAPDASGLKAAEGLATVRKWISRQQDEAIIWGECQGSGSKPYQTAVTLEDIAFHCSCPSHKFPCKHALILDFAYRGQPLQTTWLPGSQMTGEPAFYPGSVPLCALSKTGAGAAKTFDDLPGYADLYTAVSQFNHMIAHNPWLEQVAFPPVHGKVENVISRTAIGYESLY